MATGQLHPVDDRLGAVTPGSRAYGAYLHVPFCVQRCHYCSFNTAPLGDGLLAPYVAALAREVDLLGALPWARSVDVATVFLGGGTPSLLAPDELAAILDGVRRRFRVDPGAEITVECNPESVTRTKLEGYRAVGVTRLSLGVQSLDDAVLARLGRLHDGRAAHAAFLAAREAGFDNVSVDLIYGLPGLDLAGWRRTVTAVLDWAPDHVSAYGLTLDEGSPWGATGVPGLPPEPTVIAQYWAIARAATERDFEHYEISNYARPGFRSRHNQLYWRQGEYLAAGPGAAGHVGGLRYVNARALARWRRAVDGGVLPVEFLEELTPQQRLAERLILGLRTADGVPEAWLEARAAGDRRLALSLEAWRRRGLLSRDGGRARLTEAGFLVSDTLFVDLL